MTRWHGEPPLECARFPLMSGERRFVRTKNKFGQAQVDSVLPAERRRPARRRKNNSGRIVGATKDFLRCVMWVATNNNDDSGARRFFGVTAFFPRRKSIPSRCR